MSKYGICMRCLAYRVRCWAYSDKLLILIIHSFIDSFLFSFFLFRFSIHSFFRSFVRSLFVWTLLCCLHMSEVLRIYQGAPTDSKQQQQQQRNLYTRV